MFFIRIAVTSILSLVIMGLVNKSIMNQKTKEVDGFSLMRMSRLYLVLGIFFCLIAFGLLLMVFFSKDFDSKYLIFIMSGYCFTLIIR